MKDLLRNIFSELKNAPKIAKHPFRYFSLSSISNNAPLQRMVVFREIKNNTITIYTDSRTPKVSQFIKNPNASVLLYDTKNMKQIQLTGKITINSQYNDSVWESLSQKAQRDYTTQLAPGTEIKKENPITYDINKVNFCILKFTFSKIDYLHITNPEHIRAKFELINNEWKGTYLVP